MNRTSGPSSSPEKVTATEKVAAQLRQADLKLDRLKSVVDDLGKTPEKQKEPETADTMLTGLDVDSAANVDGSSDLKLSAAQINAVLTDEITDRFGASSLSTFAEI